MNGKELVTVTKSTINEFGKDDVAYMAAALTYYSFFSLFPLLVLAITLTGVFVKPEDASSFIFTNVSRAVPGSVQPLEDVLAKAFESRNNAGWFALFGVVTLLFSASGAFEALDKAINRAWNSEKVPSFIMSKLISFLMIAGLGALLVISFAVSALLTATRTFTSSLIGEVPGSQVFWQIASIVVSLATVFLVFAMVYRFLPRADVNIRDIWFAAFAAAVIWTIVKELFAYYLGTQFANFTAVYGPLGVVIALLTWIYISSVIILTGAEFSAETARVRRMRVAATGQTPGRKPSPWLHA
ncbi:MAG TPA: YihY/virulence factor BrkB family protein [Chloroflexia bacterium]|nr:YihY/virulence factor BrkB family protein [Chloroflexia bacterium]